VPTLPATFHRILADQPIEIDGRAWRPIIGHGHSPEHASLHCESLGIMIAGDMVLPKITTNVSVTSIDPQGNPLGLFLASLKRFAELPHDTLVLPSHGLVFYGLRERIEVLLHHHDERFAMVADACAAPKTAAELLDLLFKRKLDAHQLWFAMGEAIAHLHYLMYARRLQRFETNGVYRFALPST
jgi:glyoxylase-like metal-dependent hydrolase (beta-lactamase superfamily II)